MTRFLLAVATVSAVMLFAVRRLFETPPSWEVAIVAFLAVTTIAVYLFLHRKNDPEKFTRIYLGSITVKILLSCAFVMVFIVSDRKSADSNAIFFISGYLIFTATEVAFLLLKKIS